MYTVHRNFSFRQALPSIRSLVALALLLRATDQVTESRFLAWTFLAGKDGGGTRGRGELPSLSLSLSLSLANGNGPFLRCLHSFIQDSTQHSAKRPDPLQLTSLPSKVSSSLLLTAAADVHVLGGVIAPAR